MFAITFKQIFNDDCGLNIVKLRIRWAI